MTRKAQEQLERYEHNIENYVGTLRLPVGVIGPLRVNGIFAKGDYYVPLATTRGGAGGELWARGAADLVGGRMHDGHAGRGRASLAGVCVCVDDRGGAVRRLGVREFRHAEGGGGDDDAAWQAGGAVSPHVEGDHVYLVCSYTTGDAAGQNMVTIATEAVCEAIEEQSPVKPLYWFVEANFSGDKKASAMSFVGVRGRKVTASVELPGEEIREAAAYDAAADGGVLAHVGAGRRDVGLDRRAGALCQRAGGAVSGDGTGRGVRGGERGGRDAHRAARGRQAVRVGDAAEHHRRARWAAARGCRRRAAGLNILGLKGAGNARAFGEVCAAVCLAGELSIIGALCAHEFASAHKNLARGKA